MSFIWLFLVLGTLGLAKGGDPPLAYFVENVLSDAVSGALELTFYQPFSRFSRNSISLWSELPSGVDPNTIMDSVFLPQPNALTYGMRAVSTEIYRAIYIYHALGCYSLSSSGPPPIRWNISPRPAMFVWTDEPLANTIIRTWPSAIDGIDLQGEPTIGWCVSSSLKSEKELGLNKTWNLNYEMGSSYDDPEFKSLTQDLERFVQSQSSIDFPQVILSRLHNFFDQQVNRSDPVDLMVQIDVNRSVFVRSAADIVPSADIYVQNLTGLLDIGRSTLSSKSRRLFSNDLLSRTRIYFARDTDLALAMAAAHSGVLLDLSGTHSINLRGPRWLSPLIGLLLYFFLVLVDLLPILMLLLQEITVSQWASLFVSNAGIFSLLDGGVFAQGRFSPSRGRMIIIGYGVGFIKLVDSRVLLVGGLTGLAFAIRGFLFLRRIRLFMFPKVNAKSAQEATRASGPRPSLPLETVD